MKLLFLIPLILLLVSAGVLHAEVISGIEYYFDVDPGPGNGTQVLPGRDAVGVDELISTAELEPGIHRLYVRAKDDLDIWGLPQSAAFFVPFTAAAFSERSVDAIEYYFDADPGSGSGIQIHGGRDAVNLDELISTAELEPGIHRLYVRAQDDLESWGLPQSLSFLIPWNAGPGTVITRLEYFVDADPGFGNGTQVELTPGASVSVDFAASAGLVEHGNHCLYIRARNQEGGWGLPACCQFSDGIPAQLAISISDGNLNLSWEDLYGIDTYKVYSAPLPSGVYAEDTGGIFGTSDWTAPAPDPKRFYQVRSVYGE